MKTEIAPKQRAAKTAASGLPFWDPRKFLESSAVYNFFQKAVGAHKPRQRFFADHVAPLGKARVLDVGCGPGTNCSWMPPGIEYVGCDLSESYIAHARARYGSRGEFFAAPVGEVAKLGLKPFDAVIAVTILHHLSDAQVLTLCDEVRQLLVPGGVFITGDPCFAVGQSRLEHFITSCDRGRYMRYPEQYRALLLQRFPVVDEDVWHTEEMWLPNTGVVLTARYAPEGKP
jgi:SAM-dependent methyltransferase